MIFPAERLTKVANLITGCAKIHSKYQSLSQPFKYLGGALPNIVIYLILKSFKNIENKQGLKKF